MKVKKYIAGNMSEAMKQIRAELGDEAVILNSKVTHKRGFIGLFRKKQFEVIAAVDPESSVSQIKYKEKPLMKQNTGSHIVNVSEKEKLNDDLIQKEILDLKKMVRELSKSTATISLEHYPTFIQSFLIILEKQGLSQNYIQAVANHLLEKWRTSGKEPEQTDVWNWGRDYLESLLAPLYKRVAKSKKYINLVGPTGVGKTTTLAKMAANAVIDKQQKVGFITTDTYRIAAIEQLKTYANLLNVPVEVIYNMDDFHEALDKFNDFDLIFIDTAGRNYREMQYIDELKKVIDFRKEIKTYLTISLTMKEEDIKAILEGFSSIEVDHFIFTKLDETTSYGSMLNIMMDSQKGAAYLTFGQDVPDDIEEASPKMIVNHLFEGKSK
ncbi:flagellar biosynthesis protein FlhF [Bacillus sp. FJAT-49736]|uniref:flagellar biosynthesis protein FlhF n=1 Tax=Bacillus sp. FJAT-49736 TaxID=2833582 RepID=UPI001BC968BB|nr:flagellar biosynthesis protein FlhF [Bacillus sp. FJAT-49736]MBS4172535.1 flagellar biosynthesis protein FlhF [Bacillus sp. FJAT-49736]